MAIFGRRKNDTQHDEQTGDAGVAGDVESLTTDDADVVEEADSARRRRSALRPRDEIDLSRGPFDAADAPERERLDFGTMALTPLEGVEFRLDPDESNQMLVGVTAMLEGEPASAVQLQAYAAPKTSGIWYGIRREISESIVAGGGTADEVEGPLGVELHVQMASQGPDGRTTFAPARFLGIDGPRWFLRAVLSGQAAVDDEAAERALDVVRSVVIRRGPEARAPRELLELTLPPELLTQAQQQQEAAEPATSTGPLERGPEIAETR